MTKFKINRIWWGGGGGGLVRAVCSTDEPLQANVSLDQGNTVFASTQFVMA